MTYHADTEAAYKLARDRYAAVGVDADAALAQLAAYSISIHCWQGDDVGGFEKAGEAPGGGSAVTGNYPGKARTPDELRADFEQALSLTPGRHRMSLHASYAETGGRTVERDQLGIAHLELIEPPDIPRFRRLGIVANFQPFWANGDKYITEMTEPTLGPERSRWLYPIASVIAAGGVTAFGSDWSVSSMKPLDGIEVAVTHREPSKGPGPAWLPQEQIPLPEAIAGYTIRGAYLDFTEKETGSIEVGKAADLVVLDKNLFEISPSEIHQARVLWTLLEGREVYRAEGFAP